MKKTINKLNFFFSLLMLTGWALPLFSQNSNTALQHLSFQTGKSEIVLSGNYRTRGEIQQGYNIKTYGIDENETFLLSRLRLNLEYRYASRLKVFVQFQDARVTGSSFTDADFEGKNNPYHDPFDINNLYISIKPADSIEFIVRAIKTQPMANTRLLVEFSAVRIPICTVG